MPRQRRRRGSHGDAQRPYGATAAGAALTQDVNARTASEVDRNRRAAMDTLEQLDWTIGYLHGIGKTSISAGLAKNCSYIRQLMGVPKEPLPPEQTSQS